MTAEEILAVALRQSAVDMSCQADDFRRRENVVTVSRVTEGARAYLKQPFFCEMTTYGTNVVASVREDVRAAVEGDGTLEVRGPKGGFVVKTELSGRERRLVLCGGLLASL